MARTRTATINKTKVSGKVVTALLLVAIAGGVYAVAANAVNKRAPFIVRALPPKQNTAVSGHVYLGSFEISQNYPEGYVQIDQLRFKMVTNGGRNMYKYVRNLKLTAEVPCGYLYGYSPGGYCPIDLSQDRQLNSGNLVIFPRLNLTVERYMPRKIHLWGEVLPGKEDKRIRFVIQKPKQVFAKLVQPQGYGYGYGYNPPVTSKPVYPNVSKAKGMITTIIKPDPGYGYGYYGYGYGYNPPIPQDLYVSVFDSSNSGQGLVSAGANDTRLNEVVINNASSVDVSIRALMVTLNTTEPARPSWLSDIKVLDDYSNLLPVTNGTATVMASSNTPGQDHLLSLNWPSDNRLVVPAGQVRHFVITGDISEQALGGNFSLGITSNCLEDSYGMTNGSFDINKPVNLNCTWDNGKILLIATSTATSTSSQ